MPPASFDQMVTFLYTRDLNATAHFYEGLLGLPLVRDQGDCRIYRVCPGAYIGFCQRENIPADKTCVIVTLVADEVDEWFERLSREGLTVEKPPAHNPKYAIRHMFLRDPEGYLVEIQHFDEALA